MVNMLVTRHIFIFLQTDHAYTVNHFSMHSVKVWDSLNLYNKTRKKVLVLG